eukprot:3936808-Rhodomonas_salina.1
MVDFVREVQCCEISSPLFAYTTLVSCCDEAFEGKEQRFQNPGVCLLIFFLLAPRTFSSSAFCWVLERAPERFGWIEWLERDGRIDTMVDLIRRDWNRFKSIEIPTRKHMCSKHRKAVANDFEIGGHALASISDRSCGPVPSMGLRMYSGRDD